jgi:hypothetical protein
MANGTTPVEWSSLSLAEWKGRVGKSLETIESNQKEIFGITRTIQIDVAVLKAKAAFYGVAGGTVISVILFIVQYLMTKKP